MRHVTRIGSERVAKLASTVVQAFRSARHGGPEGPHYSQFCNAFLLLFRERHRLGLSSGIPESARIQYFSTSARSARAVCASPRCSATSASA